MRQNGYALAGLWLVVLLMVYGLVSTLLMGGVLLVAKRTLVGAVAWLGAAVLLAPVVYVVADSIVKQTVG